MSAPGRPLPAPAAPRRQPRRPCGLAGLALPWLLAAATLAHAAPDDTPWRRLPPAEQRALAPLASQWGSLDAEERAEWRALAARLPRLPSAEQARLQQRMQDWAQLTPSQRGQARLQFQQAQRWSADERRERWQAYQSLDPQAREVLAERWRLQDRGAPVDDAAGKRNLVQQAPPPVAPPRIASPTAVRARDGATTQPLTRPSAPPPHHQVGLPKVVAGDAFVDPDTLLPRRGPQGAAVVAPSAARPAPPAARRADGQDGAAGRDERRRPKGTGASGAAR